MAITPRMCGAIAEQVQPLAVDLLGVPGGLGQEVLQSLHCSVLRALDRFGPGQAGQGLVAIAGRQQTGQILAKPTLLRQPREQLVKAGRVVLERTRVSLCVLSDDRASRGQPRPVARDGSAGSRGSDGRTHRH
jgi:hypothetical protein